MSPGVYFPLYSEFQLFPAGAALAPALITPAVAADAAGGAAGALQCQQEAPEQPSNVQKQC